MYIYICIYTTLCVVVAGRTDTNGAAAIPRWGMGVGGTRVGAVRVPEISPLPYNNDFLALYHNNSPWKIPRLRLARIMPSGP